MPGTKTKFYAKLEILEMMSFIFIYSPATVNTPNVIGSMLSTEFINIELKINQYKILFKCMAIPS